MKKSELFFSFLLVPFDFLMIVLAGISAFYLRFAEFTIEIRPAIFNIEFTNFLRVVSAVALSWLVIFALSGLYNIRGSRRIIKEIYRVTTACSTGLILVLFVMIFFQRELFESRFILLAGWGLAIIYVSFFRAFIRGLQRFLYRYGIGVHKVIVVGSSKTTDRLIKEFSRTGNSGFKVERRLRDFSLETAQELADFIRSREIDEVVQSDPNLSKSEVLRLFDFADEHHLTFKYAADLLGAKVLQTEVMEIAGIPVVEVKKTPLDGWGRIIKRLFDIFGSLFLIVLFSPVILLVMLLIKIDSRGPIFYLDYRTGQYGKRFLFYKFRSMVAHLCDGEGPHGTEEGNKMLSELLSNNEKNTRRDQPLHKIKNDPRITRVGRFIRRWSLDELPQLFNALKGDISLVGPRPHMTLETMKYEKHHKKVLTIKPGITGLAQISGRSDLSFEEEVKLDTYYIENWSMLLDFSILFRTPIAVLKGRKVE